MAEMLQSIELNHKSGEDIHIYVIGDRVSALNKKRIFNTPEKNSKVKIIWIELTKELMQKLKIHPDFKIYPHYYYLLMEYVLPKSVKKLIYLDCDTLVLKDISELWNIDLGGCIFGAVVDALQKNPQAIFNYKELGLEENSKHFNSGVLLIDLKAWKRNKIFELVLEECYKKSKEQTLKDQYGLNVVFGRRGFIKRWVEKDRRWNSNHDMANSFIFHFWRAYPITFRYFYNINSSVKTLKLWLHYLDKTPWKGWRSNWRREMFAIIRMRMFIDRLIGKRVGMGIRNVFWGVLGFLKA